MLRKFCGATIRLAVLFPISEQICTPCRKKYTPCPDPLTKAERRMFKRLRLLIEEFDMKRNFCGVGFYLIHRFTVNIPKPLKKHERVGLTGSTPSLGEWKLERSVALKKLNNNLWSMRILLKSWTDVYYRYFVYTKDPNGNKHVQYWETHMQPRMLKYIPPTIFSPIQKPKIDWFGQRAKNEKTETHRGWLTNETILQLKFIRDDIFETLCPCDFNPESMIIKIFPITKEWQINKECKPYLKIEYTKLSFGGSKLKLLTSDGVLYKIGDLLTFHMKTINLEELSFILHFNEPNGIPIGYCYIYPEHLCLSSDTLELDIKSGSCDDNLTVGRLHLPYVKIRPFKLCPLKFHPSYTKYWPSHWPVFDIGHRGMGATHYILDRERKEPENTMISFLNAFHCRADLVEFDVHMTKDKIPIIYHDFGFYTAPDGQLIWSVKQLKYVYICNLTYKQIQNSRIFIVSGEKILEQTNHSNEKRIEYRLFPTLKQVFTCLPIQVGMVVEIKWPQELKSGEFEGEANFDKNEFVDQILYVIFKYGMGRFILIESFDCDLCTMLRYKQNVFPIFVLTQGRTRKYERTQDLRNSTFESTLNHIHAFKIRGIAMHAEDLLCGNGKEMIRKANIFKKKVIVWGEDCNNKENIRKLQKICVAGICYDDIDVHGDKEKPCSFFESVSENSVFNPEWVRNKC